MAGYVAITKVHEGMVELVYIDAAKSQVVGRNIVARETVPQALQGYIPINFGVGPQGITEEKGLLNRLKSDGSVQPLIVVNEIATKSGSIVGYKLLNPVNYSITSMKKEVIVQRQEQSKISLLQNGIIRGGKVNCYPNNPFIRIEMGSDKKKATAHGVAPAPAPAPTQAPAPAPTPAPAAVKDVPAKEEYTAEQKREIKIAKAEGGFFDGLMNPALSPEQMRVLWVSKKDGAFSELIADPAYDVDVMKYYGTYLISQKMVDLTADIRSNPKYNVEQIRELVLAKDAGIDISSFRNDPSDQMYFKRKQLESEMWNKEVKPSSPGVAPAGTIGKENTAAAEKEASARVVAMSSNADNETKQLASQIVSGVYTGGLPSAEGNVAALAATAVEEVANSQSQSDALANALNFFLDKKVPTERGLEFVAMLRARLGTRLAEIIMPSEFSQKCPALNSFVAENVDYIMSMPDDRLAAF